MNPFIADILSQPDALQNALTRFNASILRSLADQVQAGKFDRIIFTGMGSSFTSTYPAYLYLIGRGLPVWHCEASELLHFASNLIGPKTLLCMVSQSGESAEILALLERVKPAHLLAITNDATSTLARRSQTVLLIHAGYEGAVATKTYLNTVATTQLAARVLGGESINQAMDELAQTVEASRDWLADWQERLADIDRRLSVPERLFYVGRGPALATVQTGAMILKEGAKMSAEGMGAAAFRHGPFELADTRLSVVVVAGEGATVGFNRQLASDLANHEAHVYWLGADASPTLPTFQHPAGQGAGLPIVEILPFQLFVVSLAQRTGFEPGKFRHGGKVTSTE